MDLGKEAIHPNTFLFDRPIERPQLVSIEKIKRPLGYAIPGYVSLCATIRLGHLRASGYGEGPETLAIAKAVSEATERAVQQQFALVTGQSESSNGWACHISPSLAINAAILELIERDVALDRWESAGPFFEVPISLWPLELVMWNDTKPSSLEFSDLRILLSSNANGACVSALLLNHSRNFVVGHASGLDLQAAILSATSECLRSAHATLRLECFSEVVSLHSNNTETPVSPGAHSLAYAYSETFPADISLLKAKESEIIDIWNSHIVIFNSLKLSELDIRHYQVHDLHVARVRSETHRQIYWGTNQASKNRLNFKPHFVG